MCLQLSISHSMSWQTVFVRTYVDVFAHFSDQGERLSRIFTFKLTVAVAGSFVKYASSPRNWPDPTVASVGFRKIEENEARSQDSTVGTREHHLNKNRDSAGERIQRDRPTSMPSTMISASPMYKR